MVDRPDKKLSEKELFDLYKQKADEELKKLNAITRSLIKPRVEKFFTEYETRYLSGEVKPEDEQKEDFLVQLHKKAINGELPHPDELGDKILEYFSQRTGVMIPDLGPVIISEEPRTTNEKTDISDKLSFEHKPRDIVCYLDKFVIGQEEAKKSLAKAVYYHYRAVQAALNGKPIENYQKQNIVLIGPPGCGKTTLAKKIAELLKVPYVFSDATQFSPTGIVGKDATGIVRDMFEAAKQNKKMTQYGIVFIDEFDKLVKWYGVGGGSDSYGKDIQATFLRILEDVEVDLLPEHLKMFGISMGPKISTKYMLFIVAGAFDGLEDIVSKRVGAHRFGFQKGSEQSEQDYKHEIFLQTAHQDLIEFGFLGQLAGRLPVITAVHNLNEEHLYQILTQAEGNVLVQYKNQIKNATGTVVEFEDDAIREIAHRAQQMGTGARGLVTVCDSLLNELMYDLPSRRIEQLTIKKSYLDDPKNVLENALKEQYINKYQEAFHVATGIQLNFTESAIKILPFNLAEPNQLMDYLREKSEFLPQVLKSINKNQFTIKPEFLENPVGFMENYVKTKGEVNQNA